MVVSLTERGCGICRGEPSRPHPRLTPLAAVATMAQADGGSANRPSGTRTHDRAEGRPDIANQRSTTVFLRGILREPTLHFVVLAATLFAANAAVRAQGQDHVIQVDRRKIAASIMQIEASVGAPLTPEEQRRV